jgi:hypothetical protein
LTAHRPLSFNLAPQGSSSALTALVPLDWHIDRPDSSHPVDAADGVLRYDVFTEVVCVSYPLSFGTAISTASALHAAVAAALVRTSPGLLV